MGGLYIKVRLGKTYMCPDREDGRGEEQIL